MDLIKVKFCNLGCKYLQRKDTFSAQLNLQDLHLSQNYCADSMYKNLVFAKNSTSESIFSLNYDRKSPGCKDGISAVIQLKMKPLIIVFDKIIINRFGDFFGGGEMKQELESLKLLASTQIESFKSFTRASLEFALTEHKSIDLGVDIEAPIILFPSTLNNRDFLYVFNMGHLKVNSRPIDQEMKRSVSAKQKLSLSLDEIDSLQSMVYEKYLIHLNRLQILLFEHLIPSEKMLDSLQNISEESFVVKDVTLDLILESSIIPNAVNIPRFKVTGDLPFLEVFFSDQKYKGMMAVIDDILSILGSEEESKSIKPQYSSTVSLNAPKVNEEDEFYDAYEDTDEILKLDQIVFMASFTFRKTCGTISEELKNKRKLCRFDMGNLSLVLSKKQYELQVKCDIESFNIFDFQSNLNIVECGSDQRNLLAVLYRNCDPLYPDFISKYSSVVHNIDVELSRIALYCNQKAIINYYNFIMDTFTGDSLQDSAQIVSEPPMQDSEESSTTAMIKTSMKEVKLFFVDNGTIGGLSLCNGNANLLVLPSNLSLNAHLNELVVSSSSQNILFIEDGKVLEIQFDSNDDTQSLKMKSGSFHLLYDTPFFIQLSRYFANFQQLWDAYNVAKNFAVSQAQQIMKKSGQFNFDVQVSSPIIEIPGNSGNNLILELGRLTCHNEFKSVETFMDQSVMLHLMSTQAYSSSDKKSLILNPVNLELVVLIADCANERSFAGVEITGSVENIDIKMTQTQYLLAVDCIAYALNGFKPIMNEFKGDELPEVEKEIIQADAAKEKFDAVDLLFKIGPVSVTLLQDAELSEICLLSLVPSEFSLSIQADSNLEAEYILHKLTFEDCRVNSPMFPVILSSDQNENFLSLHYSQLANSNSQIVKVCLCSPRVVFDLEIAFLLRQFFSLPPSKIAEEDTSVASNKSDLFLSLQVSDIELSLLHDPTSTSSEAIVMKVQRIMFSQHGNTSLVVEGIGLFFCNMDNKSETMLKFIDDFEVNLTRELTEHEDFIWVSCKPAIVMRISFQDALLLQSIQERIVSLQAKFITTEVMEVQEETFENILESNSSLSDPVQKKQLLQCEASLRVLLIDDIKDIHLPLIDFNFQKIDIEVCDWWSSKAIVFLVNSTLLVNYFNFKVSHWVPLVEQWSFSFKYFVENGESKSRCEASKTLNLNVTKDFVEHVVRLQSLLTKVMEQHKENAQKVSANRQVNAPYLIDNKTGYDVTVWSEASQDSVQRDLKNGESVSWAFESWKKQRESSYNYSTSTAWDQQVNTTNLTVHIHGAPWESIKGIRADMEGTFSYPLRPIVDESCHFLIVDIKLRSDNIKVQTF